MNTTGTANEAHALHLENLKGITNAAQRREYIETVKRAEGDFYSDWLAKDFADWWQGERKQKEGV